MTTHVRKAVATEDMRGNTLGYARCVPGSSRILSSRRRRHLKDQELVELEI